jgi:hypothetical protein
MLTVVSYAAYFIWSDDLYAVRMMHYRLDLASFISKNDDNFRCRSFTASCSALRATRGDKFHNIDTCSPVTRAQNSLVYL